MANSTNPENSASETANVDITGTQYDRRRSTRSWLETPRDVVVGFTLLYLAIEFIGAFGSVPVQVALLAFASLVALNVAIFGYRTERTAGLVMSAVFTTRLVTFALPAQQISFGTRAVLLGGFMIAIAYVTSWVLGVDVRSGRAREGFPLKTPFISRRITAVLTILSGVPLGWIVFHALQLKSPYFASGAETQGFMVFLGGLIIIGYGEELIFRRLIAAMVQHTAQSQTPWISAMVYAGAFFGTHNTLMIVVAFIAGGLWAASCERTGSLKPVVAAHTIGLLLAYAVLPAL